MFMALGDRLEVKIYFIPFDRCLGAGRLLFLLALFTGSCLLAGLGGLVSYLGIYDRSPVHWIVVVSTPPQIESYVRVQIPSLDKVNFNSNNHLGTI